MSVGMNDTVQQDIFKQWGENFIKGVQSYSKVKQAQSIVGTGKNREKNDFYPTPPEATEALLNVWDFPDDEFIWECACGDGAISKVLKDNGNVVHSTDKYDYGYGQSGIDFLTTTKADIPFGFHTIITNQPFKLAEKFVYHAHNIGITKLAMFLKLSFLEGQARKKMYGIYKPAKVFVFSKRISFPVKGKKKSGMIAFAWYVWDVNYPTPKPIIEWI